MTKPLRAVLARTRLACLASAAAACVVSLAPRAAAQELAGADASVEAKRLFTEGSTLYLAKRYELALETLERSRKLVPSPNSELMIARCLRELGHLTEAEAMFESAETEARRRASEGAPKYTQTADSAASEGAAVRAMLGAIRIRIEGFEAGTKLEVDAAPTEVPPGGEVVVWHSPGEVSVSVRSASGLEEKQVVTVRAGAEVTVGFGRPEPVAPEPAPTVMPPATSAVRASAPGPEKLERAEKAHPARWAVPAAIASGGVTLVGAGLFVGFGLAASTQYNDLKKFCQAKAGGCTSSDQYRANAGKTYQTIANVSLVGGAVAAAATATFAIIAIANAPRSKTDSHAQLQLRVGASGFAVAGAFP